jgi:DNA-binding NarL/FixJ family response regulator
MARTRVLLVDDHEIARPGWSGCSPRACTTSTLARPAKRRGDDTARSATSGARGILAAVETVLGGGKYMSAHVAERAIATYRARIGTKLGLSTNVRITRYAIQHHLVD